MEGAETMRGTGPAPQCGAGTPRALNRTSRDNDKQGPELSGADQEWKLARSPPNPCNKIFIDMVVHDKQDKPLLQVVWNKMFIDMVVCDEQDKPLL